MWERVSVGKSGDPVFRRPGAYRKHTAQARQEAERLTWFRAQGIPAAEVLDVGDNLLITREIVGRTGADPWPPALRRRVVDAIADFTALVHAVPGDACPYDRTLAVTVPEARRNASAGLVDLDDLDVDRVGWSTAELLAELDRTAPEAQTRERPVVTHGDWTLPNVVLDPERQRVVGVLDVGRCGLADRHTDLALMARSLLSSRLNPQFGRLPAARFLKRCGHNTRDDTALAFYRLLDEFV